MMSYILIMRVDDISDQFIDVRRDKHAASRQASDTSTYQQPLDYVNFSFISVNIKASKEDVVLLKYLVIVAYKILPECIIKLTEIQL